MRLTRTFRVAAFLIAICVLLPAAAQATSQTVTIQSFAFSPPTVTINVGESVTWTNKDPVDHTATANGGAFNKPVPPNGSVTVLFSVAGTYAYHCSIHPSMTGTIVVGTTATPPPATTPPPPPPTTRPPSTPPPTAPPTAPPTEPPTASPTPSPTPSPSPSPSPSATPSPLPTATGTPITVPTGVALASPSPVAGAGPDLGSGPGPVLAAGALALALVLGGAALYLYRRR